MSIRTIIDKNHISYVFAGSESYERSGDCVFDRTTQYDCRTTVDTIECDENVVGDHI